MVELLKYRAEAQNERFGVIEFAVGADVTEAFRQAVRSAEWRPLGKLADGTYQNTGQEYAECVLCQTGWPERKTDIVS